MSKHEVDGRLFNDNPQQLLVQAVTDKPRDMAHGCRQVCFHILIAQDQNIGSVALLPPRSDVMPIAPLSFARDEKFPGEVINGDRSRLKAPAFMKMIRR